MVITTQGAVVVTGASTGIGKACALQLDKLGFQVFAGVRNPADAEMLKSQASHRLTPIWLDITDAVSIAAAVETVNKAVGDLGLWGLVNNAGIAVVSPLECLAIAELRQQMEVNVIAQIAVTQAFLPLLRRSQGRIVNIGSIIGKMAMPFLGSNSAAKFAMEAFTDVLRMELQPWGISVSIIEPSYVATPIWERAVTTTNKTVKDLPPEAKDLHGTAIAAACESVIKSGKNGISADMVAQSVVNALTTKRPKTRYLVGKEAKFVDLMIKFLPDRIRDRVIMGQTAKGT
ncbi:SDR family NAD(P)-dependent oxidoreductase [Anabaena sp. UHCC 0399]|uniref:SDR family NAD(P)-dependent oxidoreductase n=1 Tax=Anabaena sp. UHCC 0399 TaxID=3110238 RepID=UPI002B21736C|nr:SDR family NAD(P)-dependent oxidoreductase [Anabaena sp. UHCC 0399]MEA5568502.1 SDR family NAD(P)-dependent oxidoreductase [Anabaena sp. UHCC 0399]